MARHFLKTDGSSHVELPMRPDRHSREGGNPSQSWHHALCMSMDSRARENGWIPGTSPEHSDSLSTLEESTAADHADHSRRPSDSRARRHRPAFALGDGGPPELDLVEVVRSRCMAQPSGIRQQLIALARRGNRQAPMPNQ